MYDLFIKLTNGFMFELIANNVMNCFFKINVPNSN